MQEGLTFIPLVIAGLAAMGEITLEMLWHTICIKQ